MNSDQRKIQKSFFNTLDNIFKASRKIAKKWSIESIPLNTLQAQISFCKLKSETTDSKVLDWQDKYNNVLDKIYTVCEGKSKELNSSHVSLAYLALCIDKVKESFTNSLTNG